MALVHNPILPGFHPDPSMLRVGDTYYLANSTFEWWPGVSIYESKDLANWRLAARPLDRVSQLDMQGIRPSDGIWAPCLSYSQEEKLFYLVYTNVHNSAVIWDSPNYLVTAPSIEGPWSEPVYLNSVGFDPSMFHDDNGKKYFCAMISDHRPGHDRFAGVVMQEYDPVAKKLVGPMKKIWRSHEELSEGPHMFKKDGWYYVFLAYGGTGNNHSELTARCRTVDGVYEPDPRGMFITSRFDPDWPLQRAGHTSLVETPQGRWFVSCLCGRPIRNSGRCVLGRETALAEVVWTEDGWPRLKNGGLTPELTLDTGLEPHPYPPEPATVELHTLPESFLNLRQPWTAEKEYSVTARPGWLRLYGGESPFSRYNQRVYCRRIQHHHFEVETEVDFRPEHYKHLAGLVCYYECANFLFLHVTRDEKLGRCLSLLRCENGKASAPCASVPLPEEGPVRLRVHMDMDRMQFSYSTDGGQHWEKMGRLQNSSFLSDEACVDGRFTGGMVGITCCDLWSNSYPADFSYFRYEQRPPYENLADMTPVDGGSALDEG